MYQTQYLDKPCRNFCILGATPFVDPKDGLPKFAAVSFANFVCGTLYLIDPRANTAEQYTLPADNGSWAVHNCDNKELIIATCAEGAYIHCFDLESRTFTHMTRVETDTYIWDLVDGGDGYLYGGTYENCKLIRYHMASHTLEDLGRIDPNPENMYVQNVRAVPGYILADAGQVVKTTYAYRQSDGVILPLADVKDEINEACAVRKTDHKRFSLADGSIVGINGQEYFFCENETAEPICRRIPGEAPATGILTLCGDGKGKIWGATNFGLTFFNYDTVTGSYENSGNVTTYGGGEFYGMRVCDGKVYMTAYANGFHVVYDPAQPWDVQNNVNPRTLKAIEPAYIRPHGRTVVGPNGTIWTGWMAKYGVYGGALSKIDTATDEVTVYPVGDRGVASVAADDKFVYYATDGCGNGMPTLEKGPFTFAAVDACGNEVFSASLPEDVYPMAVYTDAQMDAVLLCTKTDCRVYKKDLSEQIAMLPIARSECAARFDDKLIVFGNDRKIFAVDPTTFAYEEIGSTTDGVRCAYQEGDALYYPCGLELWKLTK